VTTFTLNSWGLSDGSTTHQLIIITKNFFHTYNLSSIDPFGLDVFQKSSSINPLSNRLTFNGEYCDKMALEGYRPA